MSTNNFKATTLAVSLACLGLGSTAVLAGGGGGGGHDDDDDAFSVVVYDNMSRRPAGSASGSGHTVEDNCPVDPSGNAWQDATATLRIEQSGAGSVARVKVRGAVPDTLFTVWLRIQGGSGWNRFVNGFDDPTGDTADIVPWAGSPLTGGGATPLAPGSALDDLNAISPWVDPAGAASSINSFTTNYRGRGEFSVALDFPVIGGAYPFYETTISRPGFEDRPNVAMPIPTPEISPGTPFLIRVISHCTDQASHGLSPATREAWFQYP